MAKKENIINKHGGIEKIRQLPLLAPWVEKSKLETCYKIAKAFNRPKAALAVMKRAGKLASNEIVWKEKFSKQESKAVTQYFRSSHTKKDKKLFNETSNVTWLRKEYVHLFNNAMANGNYAEALNLFENLEKDCGRSRRKDLALDALIKQKIDLWFIEEAQEIEWNYRFYQKIETAMEEQYGQKNCFNCDIENWAKNLGGSDKFYDNMPYLKDKVILDIACGASWSGDSGRTPKLCRNLEFLGAKPIGIDKWKNDGEKFKSYQMDLIYNDFPHFENESLDGINCQNFISLDTVLESKYNLPSQNILEKYKVTIDWIEFYPGLWSATSPVFQSKWNYDRWENFIATCNHIVTRIFALATTVLKENAVISFDGWNFIKKDWVLKFKDTYRRRLWTETLKEKNKSKSESKSNIFVP